MVGMAAPGELRIGACLRPADQVFATIGKIRMRFPVTANNAFASAGADGGTPGSPRPAHWGIAFNETHINACRGFRELEDRIIVEIALHHRALVERDRSPIVADRPMMIPPSIWAAPFSGLTVVPQSTAANTL